MKSYKGFNKDLTCKGFQYKEGETYETDKAIICETGFHACEYPLDCFSYYDPANSIYHEVEQDGALVKHSDDSKVASTKIKIGLRIDFKAMIQAAINFIYEKSDNKKELGENSSVASNSGYRSVASNSGDRSVASNSGYKSVASNSGDKSVASNSGYRSVASNSGYSSVASNSGDKSVASNSGYRSVASNSGDKSVASNSGDRSVASNSGYKSVASNSGYRSVASNSGDRSVASNSGYKSVASNSGDKSVASNSGYRSVALSWGIDGKVSGSIGTTLVCAEWKVINDEWEKVDAKLIVVDGEKIKADTFYKLENGEFVVFRRPVIII